MSISSASGEGKTNMRVTLIHNPKAGDDEHPSVDEVVALIRAAGHAVTHQPCNGDHWERALDEPGDLVAVAGGDGTVGAVAVRLVGRRVPIAVLPVGTANNISTTLGLADTPIEQLIAGWADARPIGFDAGVVHGPWGATSFIEGAGVGLLASAISQPDFRDIFALARLDNREERITSGQRWLKERLGKWPAKELKLTLDDKDLSGEYILLEVMNIQHIGPSLHFAPDADPGDGLLDVVLFSAADRGKLGDYLASRLEGHFHPPQWTVPRGKHLQLRWDGSEMHVDDKTWPDDGLQFAPSPMVLDVRADYHALEFLV
jgi:diacylglycerol kinase (ATP)